MTVDELVRARAQDGRPGVRFEDASWTWAEHVAEAGRRARWYAEDRRARAATGPAHVGLLLDNSPEFAAWLAACAVGRTVAVGLNRTRRGEELARDVRSTACDVVLTDEAGLRDLRGHDLGGARLVAVASAPWAGLPGDLPQEPAAPEDLFCLVFTSGTTGAPKAVRCSQFKLAVSACGVAQRVDLEPQDVAYVAMPLFHSGAMIAGWGAALAVGATLVLRRRFSASGFLPDVRRYGVTYAHYVGTPLSYVLGQPVREDDADTTLTRCFGNEGAPVDLDRFAARFGCRVLDGFGSSEGGISISRTPDTPPGALGRGVGDVTVRDPATGQVCPPARFDDSGRLLNAEQAVGELVGAGPGLFEGYWDAPEDTAHRLRDGLYWSGDLGYADADGFLYFAGRSLDRLRVGGENFPAAPVARLLSRHPQVLEAVVYAVPDPVAGDQLMAAVVAGPELDPSELVRWLAEQPDASPAWVPRYLRVCRDLPRTATGKVLVRELAQCRWAEGPGRVWVRSGREPVVRPFTSADAADLERAFAASGRRLLPV